MEIRPCKTLIVSIAASACCFRRTYSSNQIRNCSFSVVDSAAGGVRTLNLNGRDPVEVLDLLQKVWNAQESNPIRVVIPSSQSPIRDRRIPSRGTSFGRERPLDVPAGGPIGDLGLLLCRFKPAVNACELAALFVIRPLRLETSQHDPRELARRHYSENLWSCPVSVDC